MIDLALYAVAVLGGTAGLFGHTPVLSGLAREMWAAAATGPGSRLRGRVTTSEAEPVPHATKPATGRTAPAWAHEPHNYEETA